MQSELPATTDTRNSLLRLLINQNPFYLISVAFVFHGSSHWFQANPNHNPWTLMALVSGFILLMAGTAFSLVRWGNVWDDARSIFVLVLVLFVELAMVFDDSLVLRPHVGVPLALCGYVFCVAVFEGLLWGLRIRLGRAYRLPIHIMLALMFLYPLTLIQMSGAVPGELLNWQLLGFSVLAAFSVLLLAPAVRRGRDYVANNGTPWLWPVFPWVPIVVIATGLCLRAYAACASFDPSLTQSLAEAMKLQSIFAGYFAVPLVLAVGVLFVEGMRQKQVLGTVGLLMPMAGLWLAIPPAAPTVPQTDFLTVLVGTCGSPVFITTILCMAFYAYAVSKRVPYAVVGLAAVTLLGAVVHPGTIGWNSLGAPRVEYLAGVTFLFAIAAYRRKSVGHAWVAAALSMYTFDSSLVDVVLWLRVGLELSVVLFSLIAAAVVTRSEKVQLVACLLSAMICVVVLVPSEVTENFATSLRVGYVGFIATTLLVVAIRWKLKAFLAMSMTSFAGVLALVSHEAWLRFQEVRGARGLAFYAAGIVWFLIAVAISVMKASQSQADRGVRPPE